MNIIDNLKKNAKRSLTTPAIILSDKVESFGDLIANTEALSQDIQQSKPSGLCVGILLDNDAEFIHSFFGVLCSEKVPIVFDPTWSILQFSQILPLYPLDVLIITHELLAKHYEVIRAFYPLQQEHKNLLLLSNQESATGYLFSYFTKTFTPLFIAFTSGTTSLPKGFLQSHQAWEKSFTASAIELEKNKNSVTIAPGPLYHGLTLYSVIESLTTCVSTIIGRKAFENLEFFLEQYSFISLVMVPTMLDKFIINNKEGKIFYNVTKIITSGSKLSKTTMINLFNLFPSSAIYEYYGASELGFVSVKKIINGEFNKYGSVGKSFLGVKIEIRDTDENSLVVGKNGTIWVQSPYLSGGYIRTEDQSGFRVKNLWATVGDQGYCDKNGDLYIVGREGEMIITGGLNVYPSEIEVILRQCKQIKEAFVFSVPDAYWGSMICTLLSWSEKNTKLTKNELISFCKENLSAYKCPKNFYETEQFPLTSSGKILKDGLVNMIIENRFSEIL